MTIKKVQVPVPSKCPGWYPAKDSEGFTSDPKQAKTKEVIKRV